MIAHEIHELTRDLHQELKDYSKASYFKSQFDYGALERLLIYKDKIHRNWQGISVVSRRCVDFEFADKFYEAENTKLSKRINKLYVQRDELVNSVNKELACVRFNSYESHPRNEKNYSSRGNLSIRGGKVCRDLLNTGLSCHAVSVLMDISLEKVRYQNRKRT